MSADVLECEVHVEVLDLMESAYCFVEPPLLVEEFVADEKPCRGQAHQNEDLNGLLVQRSLEQFVHTVEVGKPLDDDVDVER